MLAPCSESRKIWSFASGPATLPTEVLAEAQRDIITWRDTGLSVLELPFTGAESVSIQNEVEADLRELLALPPHFRVLFLQGGASAQFQLIPLNLLGPDSVAAYVETGHWSARAISQARQVCAVHVAARGRRVIPPFDAWDVPSHAAYCHITTNESAEGLQFHELPRLRGVPLIADMTADLLTRSLDLDRFGLIYASAQKNLGIAGLTLVIVRDDLVRPARPQTPAPFDYFLQLREHSRVNTPPTFAIYMLGRMLKWLKRQGGMATIAGQNRRKSARLYDMIDSGDFYRCHVQRECRSDVNVCFHLRSADLTVAFLDEARARGLMHLAGHPAVGGIRASLYNGVCEEAVERLANFMREFAQARYARARS